ncbi:large subunit ribosomal protein LP1 [Babesia microti strain RI]|uniref:Large subunit ribosomal protein LP1 n=1 Tax=Babesia microti (strain RI) TaxID=1133968 RepID=I7IS73_BABMR|nr:large subunit ribosomal protein LP1 [Babesia microti strain RI]CCF75386.1 large subunit ribosomal protein LP1 [Babesia microti strain RI]|eukprot:XP_012649794.1 large subunit ribosomal protein LP1 [Babesia microti strain RI]
MAQLAVEELSPFERQELLCVYSSLLLYDDELEISKENINKVLNSAGAKVEPYLPMLFAKALKGKDLNALFGSVASIGAPVASHAAATTSAAVDAPQAGKAQESNVEEEEDDDDMGFSLFD